MERVDITGTFGAAYIGSMVMLVLYGITTLQTYMYFVRYSQDDVSIKSLVSSIWVLDTIHIFFVCHAMYHYLVINYADPLALDDGIWTLYVSIGLNVSIAFVTQIFFTHRVHYLSGKKWWLTSFIALTVVAHFAFGMETMAELLIKGKLSRVDEITLIAAMPFAITAVLSDIVITIALCVLLYNSRTGFKTTNTLVNYLMVYAINRCLLTSVVAVVEVITFAVMPHSFWFLAVDFVIGKLYANSLLATLNTRSSLRGKGQETEEDSVNLTSLRIGPVRPSMLGSSTQSGTSGRRTGGTLSLSFATSNSRSGESSETKSSLHKVAGHTRLSISEEEGIMMP